MKKKNIFIFVVCGDDVHINTLNFSLKYLKHFSENEIIVVTDTARNNISINHNNIVDIKTPSDFTHHQASIYLKTGLHRFLDMQDNYCYLDSDVIALSTKVDSIFDHQYGPVTFAQDHIPISEFSPYAVKCQCKKENITVTEKLLELAKEHDSTLLQEPILIQRFNRLEKLITAFENYKLTEPALIKKKRAWDKIISEINIFTQIFIRIFFIINLIRRNFYKLFRKTCDFNEFFPIKGGFKWNAKEDCWYDLEDNLLYNKKIHDFNTFFTNHGFRWDNSKELWYDKDNNLLYDDKAQKRFVKKIKKYSGCIWDEKNRIWLNKNGENVFFLYCSHLTDAIEKKFNIKITDNNWKHWNGGVFLFNESSLEFMATWHQSTLEIFNDPSWVTRDQGTLAATTWHYGLQDQKTLPVKYNCIIDYYSSDMVYDGNLHFKFKKELKIKKPYFIHIYHEFGRKDWKVWQDIGKILN